MNRHIANRESNLSSNKYNMSNAVKVAGES